MSDNEAEAPATEEELNKLSPEELWKAAQKYHEAMAAELENPGNLIGVCAIMFTNMLIAGVMSGADMDFIDYMLRLVRDDVENGVKHLNETMQTVQ